MLIPQETIRHKRDGAELSAEQIEAFARGITDGTISDAQVAAFAMAVFLKGMSHDESVALTRSMRDSGKVLSWKGLSIHGPVIDKHSTGGVGDVVSLMLGPMLAACGAYVPMISGRGLGHTGGTLDKFDSIPGYQTQPNAELFRKTVKEVGVAIIGQTDDLAPADKRLYAIRDISATVESIPLITASILSKKLAAGLDALVMDVKVGSGAFMPTYKRSVALANSIVSVASDAGVPTNALLTDMNQVLACSAGNAVEVREAVRFLRGDVQSPRLHEVTVALCVEALLLGALERDEAAARKRVQKALDDGSAAQKFAQMVAMLGGPKDFIDNFDVHLPKAPISREIHASQDGYVSSMDTRALGMAVVALGGGRTKASDTIDHSVGLSEVASIGERVDSNRPLAIIHAHDEASFRLAAKELNNAIVVVDSPPEQSMRDVYACIRHDDADAD